jgi:hypothetical protein
MVRNGTVSTRKEPEFYEGRFFSKDNSMELAKKYSKKTGRDVEIRRGNPAFDLFQMGNWYQVIDKKLNSPVYFLLQHQKLVRVAVRKFGIKKLDVLM